MWVHVCNVKGGRRFFVVTFRLLRDVLAGVTKIDFFSVGRRRNATSFVNVHGSEYIRGYGVKNFIPTRAKISKAEVVASFNLMVVVVVLRRLQHVANEFQIHRNTKVDINAMIFHTLNIGLLARFMAYVYVIDNVRMAIYYATTGIVRYKDCHYLSAYIINDHVSDGAAPAAGTGSTSSFNVRVQAYHRMVRHHQRIFNISI